MHYIAFLLLVLNALDIVTLSTAHPPSKQQLEMSTNTITAPPTLPSELLKRQDEDFEITCGCIIGVDDQGMILLRVVLILQRFILGKFSYAH